MVNMVQNGHMASPGTVYGLLERLGGSLEVLREVFGGLQRVHGVSWDGLERSYEGHVCSVRPRGRRIHVFSVNERLAVAPWRLGESPVAL